MRFAAQWKKEILCGKNLALLTRSDDAICLVKGNSEVLLEFVGETARQIEPHYRKIAEKTANYQPRAAIDYIERALRG